MTTELSFLIDLLLNQRMPLVTKELVAGRIKEVEEQLSLAPKFNSAPTVYRAPVQTTVGPIQAASTQAILDRNPDLLQATTAPSTAPVTVVAQTPAAVAALNDRNLAIRQGMSGKPLAGETRPRKFLNV